MSDPVPVPVPDPDPRYKTIQFRVPVWSGRTALVAVVLLFALAAVGVAAWSGVQRHAADARLTQARTELAPAVRDVLDRNRTSLTQVEGDLFKLNQSLDQGLGAKTSRSIDINGYAAAQNGLSERLRRIGTDLGTLDEKEAALAARYHLRPDAALLNDDEQKDLASLQDHRKTDADQVAALDTRITTVAKHRETLAQAEADDAKKEARREKELADARRMQSQSGETVSSSSSSAQNQGEPYATAYPPYYGDPYYPYPYGYDPYYYGYRGWGPSVIIGGRWGWGGGWHGRHR